MDTKKLITRTIVGLLLPFAMVACDATDDAGRDEGVLAAIRVCMDDELACGSDPSLVDDQDTQENAGDGARAFEHPDDLAAAQGQDEPEGSAALNCSTGRCSCTNETHDSCVSKCDDLWDENCSKPASQQQVWQAS